MPRWIVGRGLLGEAVARASDREPFCARIPWDSPAEAGCALALALRAFLEEDHADGAGPREILWCAGRAVTSTSPDGLRAELDVFSGFVDALHALPDSDRGSLAVFLASSVGAAYGGAHHPPFTERTPPQPGSEYGRTKLAMERVLADATVEGRWRTLIGRITNLYGPGQRPGKGQGLPFVVVNSSVTQSPVPIYVSLDTLRDYIFEDDCGRVVDAGMQRIADQPRGAVVTKIIGSMSTISIGALLGENRRLRRRPFPVMLGGGDPRGQARDLRVRSEVWTDLDDLVRTTLPEGLDAIYRARLAGLASPRR